MKNLVLLAVVFLIFWSETRFWVLLFALSHTKHTLCVDSLSLTPLSRADFPVPAHVHTRTHTHAHTHTYTTAGDYSQVHQEMNLH